MPIAFRDYDSEVTFEPVDAPGSESRIDTKILYGFMRIARLGGEHDELLSSEVHIERQEKKA